MVYIIVRVPSFVCPIGNRNVGQLPCERLSAGCRHMHGSGVPVKAHWELDLSGPAILFVSKGPQSQFRCYWWHRSSCGTDFDISEITDPVYGLQNRTYPES